MILATKAINEAAGISKNWAIIVPKSLELTNQTKDFLIRLIPSPLETWKLKDFH